MNRFLSWPGAKYRQMDQILSVLPERSEPWKVIIEPFFGTGALTWELLSPDSPQRIFAAEKDDHLRRWWEHLLKSPANMIAEMADIRERFAEAKNDRDIFDDLRDGYNREFHNHPRELQTSALLWVLVYQSTNNLARFNSKGGYNQTWGKGRNVPDPKEIFGEVEQAALARFARRAYNERKPLYTDFRDLFKEFFLFFSGGCIKAEDCICFLDPPYIVRTETYQKGCWTLDDEKSLWFWCRRMDEQGIPWVMTNYLSKDDSVSKKVVEHPMLTEILDTWRTVPIDRKLDTRPTGSSTPVEEVAILGKAVKETA